MKTFFPFQAAGAVNVLRYQVRPLHWSCSPRCPGSEKLSNVSTSLYVCGTETLVQALSSNSGDAAFGSSDFVNFQSGLKFKVNRSPAVRVAVSNATSTKAAKTRFEKLSKPVMSAS